MHQFAFLFLILLSSCGPTLIHGTPEPITKQARWLMGTLVEVTIAEESLCAKDAIDEAFRVMKDIEALMSVYREKSEVNFLNESGDLAVTQETFTLVREAILYSQLTNGAFDITLSTGGWENITLDKDSHRIILAKGTKIDLGGIAKGYAVDKAIQSLKAHGITNALVNAGGDIYCLGRRPNGELWSVGIRDPNYRDKVIEILTIEDRAVATSGDYERPGHIVDPRIGRYVSGSVDSVTVIAPTCTMADALATAVFVLGPDEGQRLLDELDEVEGIIFKAKN